MWGSALSIINGVLYIYPPNLVFIFKSLSKQNTLITVITRTIADKKK